MNFNLLDVIIALILVLLTFRGFHKGFFKNVFSLLGVVIGFLFASVYYPELEALLHDLLGWPYLNFVSFGIVFVLIYIGVVVVGYSLRNIINIPYAGGLDRLLGAALGLVKGIVVVSLLLIILTAFLPSDAALLRESKLAPRVYTVSETIEGLIPPRLRKEFADRYKAIKKSYKEKIEKMKKPKPLGN